jgi:ComF family protein
MFRQLIRRASQQIPARCAVCHAWPSRVVCDACVARFAQPVPRCRTCALPVPAGVGQCGACLTTPPPLDSCLAAVAYAWPWSHCIAQFKFGGQPGWAAALATVMRSTPWVEPALDQADRLLPMPLARERLAERGFNQALLLAQRLAPGQTDASLLLRTRHTPAQSALNRSERLRNVQGAFAVEPLRAHELQGQRVVLVDDVMTSGASLHAAALTVRQAGASHVTALVFARTE